MHLADTLSQAYQGPNVGEPERSETDKEVESIHAMQYLAISEVQLNKIKQETVKRP